MSDFIEWNNVSDSEEVNKKRKLNENSFNAFSKLEYWAYADYKYMIELLKSDSNHIDQSVSLLVQIITSISFFQIIGGLLEVHSTIFFS